jgi:mono/diheme cytochrome c family protein
MKTGCRQAALLMALILVSTGSVAADGPALYKDNCAKCHGDTGHADNWRGHLFFARNFTSPKWQAKMSDADILEEINEGPRIMPAFKDKLSEAEKQALIRVLRGFSAP